MKIDFVELKTGNLFHVGSGEPYTFWFEGGQSINLNYVQRICFVADVPTVRVQLHSPVFSILKMDQNIPMTFKEQGEWISSKKYLDLELLKTDDWVMTGWMYAPNNLQQRVYVYILYILASSPDAGEIRDHFTLEDQSFEVGADFYTPNEILKSNLENFDISIPESIQKAIYDVNVHEESNDNITINRKYKELLMNYWDIVANKGSYNSLINSLAWFEWGDLVRIEEVWKRFDKTREDYLHTELNKELSKEFTRMLATRAKTTYIGLYMAMQHLTYDPQGNLEYQNCDAGSSPLNNTSVGTTIYMPDTSDLNQDSQVGISPGAILPPQPIDPDTPEIGSAQIQEWTPGSNPEDPMDRNVVLFNEEIPNLERWVLKWNLLELCLKMTLLGNFYSTYFMPIHMDLIHSTVEYWVFGYTQKLLTLNGMDDTRVASFGNSFDVAFNPVCRMRHVVNRAVSTTLFKSTDTVFGLEESIQTNQETTCNPLLYWYGGSAGVSDCEAWIPAQDENERIWAEQLVWYNITEGEGIAPATLLHQDEDPWWNVILEPRTREGKPGWWFNPQWKLGFKEPGQYLVAITFRTTSSRTWTRTLTIKVLDTTANQLKLWRMVPRTPEDRQELTPALLTGPVHCFQMCPGENTTPPNQEVEYREHSILVTGSEEHPILLNHTVVFNVDQGSQLDISCSDSTTRSKTGVTLADLEQWLPTVLDQYIWVLNQAPSPYNYIRCIGVARQFNTETNQVIITGVEQDGGGLDSDNLVLDFRFQPCMWMVEPYDGWNPETGVQTIGRNDILYVEPRLKYSRNIQECNWTFRNISTGEVYESVLWTRPEQVSMSRWGARPEASRGGMQSTPILSYNGTVLHPGYHSVELRYRKGSTTEVCSLNSAFIIGK